MFGPCRVCAEKDKRIADLHKQITFLQQQVAPQPMLPSINMSAAARILDGGTEEPELTTEQLAEQARIETERNLLLSGNYS